MALIQAADVTVLLRSILRRLIDQERRGAGSTMRGKVTAVDPEKAQARIEIGKDSDGNPVLSPWLPYRQVAGALKIHHAPSVGQTMEVSAENGDLEQGVLEPFHWNDDNQANSTDGSVTVLTLGDTKVTIADGSITIEIGGVSVVISGDGVKITGGEVTHDDHNIGHDHKHTEVLRGGDLTGPPE